MGGTSNVDEIRRLLVHRLTVVVLAAVYRRGQAHVLLPRPESVGLLVGEAAGWTSSPLAYGGGAEGERSVLAAAHGDVREVGGVLEGVLGAMDLAGLEEERVGGVVVHAAFRAAAASPVGVGAVLPAAVDGACDGDAFETPLVDGSRVVVQVSVHGARFGDEIVLRERLHGGHAFGRKRMSLDSRR